MRKTVFSLILCLSMLGCAKQVHAPVPGAANQFDSDTYLSLVTTDSVIVNTRQALVDGQFPASISGHVKESLNYLIDAYDAANVTYMAYHASAVSGSATPAEKAAVTEKMNTVSNSLAALNQAKGGR